MVSAVPMNITAFSQLSNERLNYLTSPSSILKSFMIFIGCLIKGNDINMIEFAPTLLSLMYFSIPVLG